MKPIIFLLFQLCHFTPSFSQGDNGLLPDNKLLKIYKVKEIKTFFFKSDRDSMLNYVNNYDTLGKLLSAISYTDKGRINTIDTCIYDASGRLTRRWKYIDHDKSIEEHINKYDSNGNSIRMDIILNDTLTYYNLSRTDKINNIIVNEFWDAKADSIFTITRSSYDSLLRERKTTIINAGGDSTVYLMNYDAPGNLIRRREISGDDTKTWKTELMNDKACGNSQTVTTDIETGKLINKTTYLYYPNCLVYEKIILLGKARLKSRSYYTYY